MENNHARSIKKVLQNFRYSRPSGRIICNYSDMDKSSKLYFFLTYSVSIWIIHPYVSRFIHSIHMFEQIIIDYFSMQHISVPFEFMNVKRADYILRGLLCIFLCNMYDDKRRWSIIVSIFQCLHSRLKLYKQIFQRLEKLNHSKSVAEESILSYTLYRYAITISMLTII